MDLGIEKEIRGKEKEEGKGRADGWVTCYQSSVAGSAFGVLAGLLLLCHQPLTPNS